MHNYSPFPSDALDCQHLKGPPSCVSLFPELVCFDKCLLNKLLTNQIREGLPHLGIQGPQSFRVGLWSRRADLEALS